MPGSRGRQAAPEPPRAAGGRLSGQPPAAPGRTAHARLRDRADAFRAVTTPQVVDGQRVAALRFTDPRVQALLSALVVFRLLPEGFANRDLRALLARLLGVTPDTLTPGSLTYHLRRLRLHGFITRIDGTHRYRVTAPGLRTALFFTRVYARVLRPGLAHVLPRAPTPTSALRHADRQSV